jgi:hypothetical protein
MEEAPPPFSDSDSVTSQPGTSPDLKKARRKKAGFVNDAANIDRLLPHSPEAEQGVLGCILLSPTDTLSEAQSVITTSEFFYDLRHQTIWKHLCNMGNNGGIDLLTLQQHLKNDHALDEVGGIGYLGSLPDTVPSASNLSYYLGIIDEKYTLRRLIQTCTEVVERVYEHEGEVDTLLEQISHDITEVATRRSQVDEHWRMDELLAYDVNNDPNAIIGFNDGKATRYLCRGYGAWLIGQSGIGKSSLVLQQSFSFTLGRPFCGITPVKPLRVLIVQSENDIGDNAETAQGIADSMPDMTPKLMDEVRARLKIIRCRGRTGAKFCQWLEREVVIHRADLVYVDPLIRFAGIEVGRQDQVTQFLNNHLDPVLARTGVVMIGAHHTGKPKGKQENRGQTIYDMAYSGIGSSELVNWARAIIIVEAVEEGIFRMILSKRGNRAFASHPDGTPSTIIYLKHAFPRIYWEQTDPPEPKTKDGKPAGRKSKIQEVATSNLYEFLLGCKSDGEGKNEVAVRLEAYLAKLRVDVSPSTSKRIVAELVANGKLKKTDSGLYLKGPEA